MNPEMEMEPWYVRVSQHWGKLPSSQGELIMSWWESPCPCRPGLCDPSCNKSHTSQKRFWSQTLYHRFSCGMPMLSACPWKTLNSELPEQNSETLHNSRNNTWYLLYDILYTRGPCNTWLLKKLLIYSMYYLLLCLVPKQQTHCVQAYFVPNVLQEYFEINTQVYILSSLLDNISNIKV